MICLYLKLQTVVIFSQEISEKITESNSYLVEKFGLKPIQASSESVSEAARELKLKHGLDKVYPVIYNVDQKFLVKRIFDKDSGKLSVSHMWSINFVTSNTGITVTVLNIGNDS